MKKNYFRLLPALLAGLMVTGAVSTHASAEQTGKLTDATLPANATYNGIVIPEGYEFYTDPNYGHPVTAPYLISQSEGGYAPTTLFHLKLDIQRIIW